VPITIESFVIGTSVKIKELTCMVRVKEHVEVMGDSVSIPSPPSLDHVLKVFNGWSRVQQDILRISKETNTSIAEDTELQLLGPYHDFPITIEISDIGKPFKVEEFAGVISVKDHIVVMSHSISRPGPPSLDHFFILFNGRSFVHIKLDTLITSKETNTLASGAELQLSGPHNDLPLAIESQATSSSKEIEQLTCMISVKDHIVVMIDSISRPSP